MRGRKTEGGSDLQHTDMVLVNKKYEKENVIYLTFKSQRWKEENLSCCFVVTLWCYSVIGNGIFPCEKALVVKNFYPFFSLHPILSLYNTPLSS